MLVSWHVLMAMVSHPDVIPGTQLPSAPPRAPLMEGGVSGDGLHFSCPFFPLALVVSLVWGLWRGVVFSLSHHPMSITLRIICKVLGLMDKVFHSLTLPQLEASSRTTCPLPTHHVGRIPDALTAASLLPPTGALCYP